MPDAYSDEIRNTVLDDVRNGVPYREIAETHSVSKSVIGRWAKAAGVEPARSEHVEAAATKNRLAWVQRRGELVDDLGEVAAELLQKARETDTARDAQAFATSVAILIDKAQLVSGGATTRHEHLDQQQRRHRVEMMRDELAERREQKDGTTGS